MAHSYHHVLFYKNRMDDYGLKPEDIQTVGDLAKLPLCTKTEMREGYPHQVVADGYGRNKGIVLRTSGSTGKFLEVLHSQESFDYVQALGFRQYYGLGYRPWHTRAYFRWESFGYSYPFEKIGVLRKVFIPALIEPEEQLSLLLRCKPYMITGYPSTLYRFIRGVEKEKIRRIQPRFIVSNSEQLTTEVSELIRDAFGCEIYDEYSMFEVFHVAFECSHHSYHIVSDNVILECVDSQGNQVKEGEVGEIVVTGFMNKAMPFIRYRTNDFGILSNTPCECGRTFPILKKLIGRIDDFIVLPSKKLVGPPAIIGFFYQIDQIKEFQVVQENIDKLVVKVIPSGSDENELIRKEIVTAFHKAFPGEPLEVSVVFVDEIKIGSTGKRKSVISNPKLLRQVNVRITSRGEPYKIT